MFDIIGYWLTTTILVAPLWVAAFLCMYFYMDEVYYQVPDNHTHLPFYNKLNSLWGYDYMVWVGVILAIISAVFTLFAGLIGFKVGVGFVEGVINSAHSFSTLLSSPVSWLVSVTVILFAIRTTVQFAAKFAVMRNKIDQLNK